jgi:hypothetical protein
MTSSPELIRLQQSVRESRISISKEYAGLISELDFKKRFTESVRHHPLRWIGGAAGVGLLATIFGGGKGSTRKSSLTSAGSVTSVAAPMLGAAAQGASTLSKISWVGGALELGKLLYPILRPVVVDLLSNAAQAGLAKRGR